MITIYAFCLIANALQAQILAIVGQRYLNKVRQQLFNKMQSLPIRYFDSHQHGEIMSYYTNDVDSIRQFITQSLIQFISTAFSLFYAICIMVHYSVWLFLLVLVGALLMTKIIKSIGKKSSEYFVRNHKATADMEGFIEEMINGQKVIKVFTHEEISKQEFQMRFKAHLRRYMESFLNPFKLEDIDELSKEFQEPSKEQRDIKIGDLFKLGKHKLLCGDKHENC